jgi:hypothetical protein
LRREVLEVERDAHQDGERAVGAGEVLQDEDLSVGVALEADEGREDVADGARAADDAAGGDEGVGVRGVGTSLCP